MKALGPSAHVDSFTRDRLPPADSWPELLTAGFEYPARLNAAVELTDRMVERGFGDHAALIGHGRMRTYKELADWTSRLALALVEDLGVLPGNRVLIRSANNPAAVACWLAAIKAGAVVINTIPELRTAELTQIIDKAEVRFALCDTRLMGELVTTAKASRFLQTVIGFDATANFDAELDRIALRKPVHFYPVETAAGDVALIAMSTGASGAPKLAMHFHRDLLAIADGYAREVLEVTPEDVFLGSPPLGFTFGLGGLAVFPLRFGAASVLLEEPTPAELVEAMRAHRATILLATPSVYERLIRTLPQRVDLAPLRIAVSAGDALPLSVFEAWKRKTGVSILDGIGGTEMLHIFISNRVGDAAPGSTGRVVAGYEARIVDADMREKPRGEAGRLAVRGPTGCRYLADPRQSEAVRDGWTLTGDTFLQDKEGRFHFVARVDDMIHADGESVAAPEVEDTLRAHPLVEDCAVIGVPDQTHCEIVKAFVVLAAGQSGSAAIVKQLQEHVRSSGAQNVPRSIRFVDSLPKTATGKVQRFLLRQQSPQPPA